MKKIFIVLSIFGFLAFIPFKSSASFFADNYGTYMTYSTLKLNEAFNFSGNWWTNEEDTYIFEYKPVDQSLEDLLTSWGSLSLYYMDIHNINTGDIYPYLNSKYDTIFNGDMAWTSTEYIYLVVKQEVIDDNPEWITPVQAIGVISQVIRVDTWIITETSPAYDEGYSQGYENGYSNGIVNGNEQGYNRGYYDGYNDGFDNGDEQGYNRGIQENEAYELGYEAGANESFLGSMDKWLVPSIIIIMILGGFFAIARKKRDGDI